MLKGASGQCRPADVIGCAIAVARIATGAAEESLKTPSGKVKSGKAGGAARAAALSDDERPAIAKRAAMGRWK